MRRSRRSLTLVSDLLRLLFFVLRGDQIIKGTVDQGQLGDVVVDAEYIVKVPSSSFIYEVLHFRILPSAVFIR